MAATGTPGVWVSALATVLVLGLLAALLVIVVLNAVVWFWPAPILELRLEDGTTVAGVLVAREHSTAATTDEQDQIRIQLKTGNRELSGQDFRWIDERSIVERSTPEDLVRLIRFEYGDAFGRIVAATAADGSAVEVGHDGALERLLALGRSWHAEQEEIERRMERVRRPLTRVEEKLALLERSAHADSDEGQALIRDTGEQMQRLADELAPQLQDLEQQHLAVTGKLQTAGLLLRSGDSELQVPLADLVELVPSNRMGWPSRLWWAMGEALRFTVSEPREANTEGGIYPALLGTVLMVMLMSIVVMPLGVLTAVYMTEYARQGLLLRLATQAVNNLAGVPSIVFGMFGLAFFIYGVGGTIDRLFFPERLPTPTFGTGGMLWAALTLALLTVPSVVVATREGLLAVPRSWRDGSLALGATRWQTLLRITLPAAMPGILTGFILAVSRAAGEVAPLMLTGAVKLAPSLAVDGEAPFLHLQRKFMHLGFHIFDVSMQSPNVEAAKPMAFASTAVLLLVVLLMNLAAIIVRRRLRRAYRGQAV